MASTVRIGYWNGAAPTFTGASDSGVTAEAGFKFNREDTLSGTSGTIPIPTATGTNYSWIKNLGLEVTATAPTNISSRQVAAAASAAEVQTFTETGSPTGGTFTVTFNGGTSGTINWNSTAAACQTTLQAMPQIGTNNATCSGGPLNTTPITITFAGALATGPQSLFAMGTNSLTGGSSPSITFAETTKGIAALGSGLTLDFKGVASGSYAQAASGNQPAASGSNGAVPSTYTGLTTSFQTWDSASVSANTLGLNGQLLVMVCGVDFTFSSPVGQALNNVALPDLKCQYNEA